MKSVILLREFRSGRVDDLPMALASQPWADAAERIVVQLGMPAPIEPGGDMVPPIYDAVVELWSDAPIELSGMTADWTLVDARSSHEVIGKAAERTPPVGVTPGLSQLSFIQAIDAMPRAESERHWDEHIPLARAIHVGMNRYVQDRLSPAGEGARPWFGMAHLHFPDEAALRDGLFRSPEDVAVIGADVAEFVSHYASMLAIEHVVKG